MTNMVAPARRVGQCRSPACSLCWTVAVRRRARCMRSPPIIRRARLQIIVPFPPGGSADYFARTVFNKLAPDDRSSDRHRKQGRRQRHHRREGRHQCAARRIYAARFGGRFGDHPAAVDRRRRLSMRSRTSTPVTGIGTVPAVLVVKPSLGIKTFAEFLRLCKGQSGQDQSCLVRHRHDLASDRRTADARNRHQDPARSLSGAPPAVTDLLGGHADIMFSDAPFFLEHIKAGKLIPLAVGTPQRAPSLPDVPTTAELGYPAIVASNTYSLFAPAQHAARHRRQARSTRAHGAA